MGRIIPNLWFNDNAEEAANFYSSIFENVSIGTIARYTEAGKEQHGHEAGQVMTVEFEIEGLKFVGINGGPVFQINPAISFSVRCKSVDEVNALWEKLSEGGDVQMPLDEYPFSKRYGWLNDKFGVSWQLMCTEAGVTQKIVPSLLFTKDQAGKAEEAMHFYASVFPDSSIGTISRYPAGMEPDREGTINYGEVTVLGAELNVMDSARQLNFSFNEGVSLMVNCDSQAEIDEYWEKLSAVPEAEQCGWLKDKYGVSWQIVSSKLNDMLKNGTPEQIERVSAAFMQMKKFDLAKLDRAYKGE